MADKSNFTGSKKGVTTAFKPRSIRETKGGWINVSKGRTSDTSNIQTNPLYASLNKRRGFAPWGRARGSNVTVLTVK